MSRNTRTRFMTLGVLAAGLSPAAWMQLTLAADSAPLPPPRRNAAAPKLGPQSPHPTPKPGRVIPASPVLDLQMFAPPGTQVVYFVGGEAKSAAAPVTARLLPMHRYYFALDNLPMNHPHRVYGTIEVLRPSPMAEQLPAEMTSVPVAFNADDAAVLGRDQMLTKIIVLENPDYAIPEQSTRENPIRYDVSPGQNPVAVAKNIGKLVAVVRMGSRVPTRDELMQSDIGGYASACAATPGCPVCPNGIAIGATGLLVEQYICDGGDIGRPVQRSPGGVLVNVDPTDTVAEYHVECGKDRVAISNRVCVFSPRYVEVRWIQMVEGVALDTGPKKLERDRMLAMYRQTWTEAERILNVGPEDIRMRVRPTEIASEQWPSVFVEVRSLEALIQIEVPKVNLQVQHLHRYVGLQQPMILKPIVVPLELMRTTFPQIIGMVEGIGELNTVWSEQEYQIVEENPCFPPLCLEKFASEELAAIGDEITFVIRYTNPGDRPVTNVAVVDNLSARLDYVEDSAESQKPAIFTAQPNDVGSMVLRWELKEPLKSKESGMVRFRAKVR